MGFQTELTSGAHIFVKSKDYHPVCDAIVREGWQLQRRHVVVTREFEDVVIAAVKELASKLQVRLKRRTSSTVSSLSVGSSAFGAAHVDLHASYCAEQQMESGSENEKSGRAPEFIYVVKRTFIHIPVPASLYSGPSSGQKTASTGDANPRVHFSPRKV